MSELNDKTMYWSRILDYCFNIYITLTVFLCLMIIFSFLFINNDYTSIMAQLAVVITYCYVPLHYYLIDKIKSSTKRD